MDKPQVAQLMIPQDVAQALVNYLQQRPFVEVHGLIGALMRLQPVPDAPQAAKANGAQGKQPGSGATA